jgi:DNA-binding LacI/PurR family transcriptional regulator
VSTIRDVARRAGVAISTVSAVINRSAPASAAVIARVEKAIAEIGYAPQHAAQTLRSGRSRLIGLIIPDIANPHFATVARVVEHICLAAGYMTFVYNTDEDAEHEMLILKMMRMQSVAGLILISTRSDAAHGVRLLSAIDTPTVLMGSDVEGTPFDIVTLDEKRAGRLAAECLADLGHRQIAVIAGRRGVSTNEERLEGCRAVFRERGLGLSDDQIVHANFNEDMALEATRQLMADASRPTAILSLSNLMTIGVMRGVAAASLVSPRDVSIIGVDDFAWADIMNPQPTTIAQPIVEMTRVAIHMLLEQIATGAAPGGQHLRFEPRLIFRASCEKLG